MRSKKNHRRRGFSWLMVHIGMSVVHSLSLILGLLWLFVGGGVRMIWYILQQIWHFFVFLWQSAAGAFRTHNESFHEMMKKVRLARKEGGGAFGRALVRLIGMYIFGEHGLLRTGFNYVMPVLSVLFLAAIVRYGTGLDYGISVVCNGEELGIIASESEFTAAEAEVRQRLADTEEQMDVSFHPTYTLKIISEEDQYVDFRTLADKLLAGSSASLTEAYGVYVDGEFIGAVADKEAVSSTMDRNLAAYAGTLDDMVAEVYYTKNIAYETGIYLTASLRQPGQILSVLTAETQTERRYVAQKGDSPELIALKFEMDPEELHERNPHLVHGVHEGMLVKVLTPERYIPIAYTKNMTVTSYIDYETMDVETSALNLGVTKVIAKGVLGEKRSEVLVTYVDGMETGREVLSSAVTKEPVPEQIGIGTYSPEPASSKTKFYGNGMFGWPVNGGYISDPYISDRNHKGIDIAAPYGTEIYASGGGTVVISGWNAGGYGNYVIIDHGNGYRTLYGHCSALVAVTGQTVEKGQLIAYVGSTGRSTGNHLHYEVRINNVCTNPGDYLRVNVD
ncbi:MAG: peptidoglycan DD-metalloendopeptidase family protein [Oscillospiraceae bacterium]|nr:peptidoglycan DD-metalloendopeptidase family protein [Oscillospiraceae bacterium]